MGLADLLNDAFSGVNQAIQKYPEILHDLPSGVPMRKTVEYLTGFCTQYVATREVPSAIAREASFKIMVGMIKDAHKRGDPYADKMQALYNKALFDEPQE